MSMLAELEQARRDLSRLSRCLTEKRVAGRRTCSKCKKLCGPDGFYKHKDGRRSQCKQCVNETRRKWREANPERSRAYDNGRSRLKWQRIKADPVLHEEHKRGQRESRAKAKAA